MNIEIVSELKKMNKLLILILTKDMQQTDKIITLYKADFTPKEIADLIGTTSNTVSVAITTAKKKGKMK